jgi:hypothetical protein
MATKIPDDLREAIRRHFDSMYDWMENKRRPDEEIRSIELALIALQKSDEVGVLNALLADSFNRDCPESDKQEATRLSSKLTALLGVSAPSAPPTGPIF